MVSQNISSTTDVAVTGRGFVADLPTTSRPSPAAGAYFVPVSSITDRPLGHYWGSVIAGALTMLSIGIMSEALMIACHVGTLYGHAAFGWGAGIWMVVTACIAYFFGGWAATCVGNRREQSWVRGLGVWALSVPLLLVLGAFIAGSFGLAYGSSSAIGSMPMGNGLSISFGAAWATFVSLIAGLFFSLLGGSMTPARDAISENRISSDIA